MTKTYTFKQIIFGLRKEYNDIEKQLTELKKYVDVNSKVDNYYFHITGNPSKLFLCLYNKKNILEKIEMLLGQYIPDAMSYDVTRGANNSYYYSKEEICSITNQDELNEKIKKIVKTDFFNNILANNNISIPCNENRINSLLITAGHIGLINGINGDYSHLDYYPCEDMLLMRNEEKHIIPDDIFKLLNLSLDGNYLNDYHHRVLDNYEEKEIYIDDSFNSNEAKLEIIEEPKKLILSPKKNI